MAVHQTYLSNLQLVADQTRRELTQLMPHRGELGRITEDIIRGVLERLLPKRFSIGTGVIINSAGKTSAQTDIVIYDNFFNSPLLSEFGARLFPVECVYATIEVKSVLNPTEIKKALEDVKLLREIGKEKHYVVNKKQKTFVTPPRSYVVGFRAKGLGKKYKDFTSQLANLLDGLDTHVHGVCIFDKDWFAKRRAEKHRSARRAHNSPAVILGKEGNALTQLYRSILIGQDNFAVYPMNVRKYLGHEE